MSDLDQVQRLIAQGDKEKAIAQLASILLKNRNDLEAWLLMGEIIDDPSRKKDCYRWALKLAPHNELARTRLEEVERPPSPRQTTKSPEDPADTKPAINKPKQFSNPVPNQNLYPTANRSGDDTEVVSYFLVGLAAFFVVLYVLVTGDFSEYSSVFCWGLFFLCLSTGVIILIVMNKNRS